MGCGFPLGRGHSGGYFEIRYTLNNQPVKSGIQVREKCETFKRNYDNFFFANVIIILCFFSK